MMPTFLPIADLSDTTNILELCNQKEEPIFITKNTSVQLVVMSMETYEKKIGIMNTHQIIDKVVNQVEDKTSLVEGNEVFTELRGTHRL